MNTRGIITATFSSDGVAGSGGTASGTIIMPQQARRLVAIKFDPTVDLRLTIQLSNTRLTLLDGDSTKQGAGAPYLYLNLPESRNDNISVNLTNKEGSAVDAFVTALFEVLPEFEKNMLQS